MTAVPAQAQPVEVPRRGSGRPRGIPMSEGVRKTISLAKRGQRPSPEARGRMRESALRRWESPEARARMRESALRRWESPEQRRAASERARVQFFGTWAWDTRLAYWSEYHARGGYC